MKIKPNDGCTDDILNCGCKKCIEVRRLSPKTLKLIIENRSSYERNYLLHLLKRSRKGLDKKK